MESDSTPLDAERAGASRRAAEAAEIAEQEAIGRALVVLIGPMGAGKTSIGKRLARSLGAAFLDTDRMIVAEHGPVATIFDEHGEEHFRELERLAVATAIRRDAVVALGGGAVLHPETRAALAAHPVVYLTTSAEAVESRLGTGTRPLVRGGVSDWVRIFESRRSIYEGLADLTVDTSRLPIDRLAHDIALWVGDRAAPPTQLAQLAQPESPAQPAQPAQPPSVPAPSTDSDRTSR